MKAEDERSKSTIEPSTLHGRALYCLTSSLPRDLLKKTSGVRLGLLLLLFAVSESVLKDLTTINQKWTALLHVKVSLASALCFVQVVALFRYRNNQLRIIDECTTMHSKGFNWIQFEICLSLLHSESLWKGRCS